MLSIWALFGSKTSVALVFVQDDHQHLAAEDCALMTVGHMREKKLFISFLYKTVYRLHHNCWSVICGKCSSLLKCVIKMALS